MMLRREESLGGKITNPENSAWFICSLIQLPNKPLLGTHYELDIMPVASDTKANKSLTVFFLRWGMFRDTVEPESQNTYIYTRHRHPFDRLRRCPQAGRAGSPAWYTHTAESWNYPAPEVRQSRVPLLPLTSPCHYDNNDIKNTQRRIRVALIEERRPLCHIEWKVIPSTGGGKSLPSFQRHNLFFHPQKRLASSSPAPLSPPPLHSFSLPPPTCGSRKMESLSGQLPMAVEKTHEREASSELQPAQGQELLAAWRLHHACRRWLC